MRASTSTVASAFLYSAPVSTISTWCTPGSSKGEPGKRLAAVLERPKGRIEAVRNNLNLRRVDPDQVNEVGSCRVRYGDDCACTAEAGEAELDSHRPVAAPDQARYESAPALEGKDIVTSDDCPT